MIASELRGELDQRARIRAMQEAYLASLLLDPRLEQRHIDAALAIVSLSDPDTGEAVCSLKDITARANQIAAARRGKDH